MNKQKLHVRKGDMVALTKAITGVRSREKGYQGRILRVFPQTQRVIVEGVNVRVRHTKPNQTHPHEPKLAAAGWNVLLPLKAVRVFVWGAR